MALTDYHASYFAHELTRRCPPDSDERLAGAVASAQVDLNPHQVDAALFAFQSPLSRGALLADEVGLGKTIEAGLVLSQKWAEHKRRILIITPASLRKPSCANTSLPSPSRTSWTETTRPTPSRPRAVSSSGSPATFSTSWAMPSGTIS